MARTAARTLKRFRAGQADVSITFVGTARMRGLNRRFHGRDRVTDVLAFDLRRPAERRGAELIAEVVIAPDVAARTAATYGHTYAQELLTYVAHGLLHLLGFRDNTPRKRQRMNRLQAALIR